MRLERIEVRNYRCLRHLVLADLPRMAVVIGANGAGKSTLFEVLGFVKESVTANAASAVARRGGLRELLTRGQTGPVGITLRFRESGGRLATYLLEVAERDGRVVIERELLRYRRGQTGRPWRFVSFSRGAGAAITNESTYGQPGAAPKRRRFRLDDPSVPAVRGLGQFRNFPVVSEFRRFIETWRLPDSRFAEALPDPEAACADPGTGDEPASTARFLYENHRDRFDRILETMRTRVPGVESVEARPTEDGHLTLRFRDRSFPDPFPSRQVSDGTLRLFAGLVLLDDPRPRGLLAVETPETHLHHRSLFALAEDFRLRARRGGPVFVSTHSTDFLNGARLDEIFWLEKRNGVSTARRASDDERIRRLHAEGDLPGALWRQGLFPGAGLN